MNKTIVSVESLQQRLGADLIVFDCRFNLADPDEGEAAWREQHIPGAVYAHLDRDLSSAITAASGRHPLPDPASFAAWLGRNGVTPDHDGPVVGIRRREEMGGEARGRADHHRSIHAIRATLDLTPANRQTPQHPRDADDPDDSRIAS